MAVQYEGREVKIGIAEEATFGTAIADSGSFTEIKTEPVEIDMDVRMHDIPGAAGSKTPLQDSKYSTTTGSMPKFTTNGPYSTYESDLFLYAAEKLGIAPENCIVVEDSDVGIEAARNAGMKALRFFDNKS